MITYNSTAALLSSKEIKQKRFKSWDMRYHWIRDKLEEKYVSWEPGTYNKRDYPTKHWSPIYHQQIRPVYMANCLEERINHIHSLLKQYISGPSLSVQGCIYQRS